MVLVFVMVVVDGLVDDVVCAELFGPVPVRVLDLIEVGLGMGGRGLNVSVRCWRALL